ncbi:Uncharacterised protein [Enterobacter ludwigii]|jgi:hypothetical protein|nr:Uncharacterised protein [Enterobacter ludwigii]SAH38594.1 Uncharacterised protein [Enterobacter ludwigii]
MNLKVHMLKMNVTFVGNRLKRLVKKRHVFIGF